MDSVPDFSNTKEKLRAHIRERYQHHRSLRKTADEFGIGKSTVHRIIAGNPNQEDGHGF